MPRTARISPKGYVYHVLARGNSRQAIFRDKEDYLRYLETLLKYKEKFRYRLYHYILMANHVHLVLEPVEKGGVLSEIMKGINLSYAQHYKKKYRHDGYFWQDRFKSILISKDNYLLACGSYVELNPVRAKIVDDPKKYEWSSYRGYAYGKNDPLLDKHPIYELLARGDNERRKKYREFIKGMVKKKASLRGEMDGRMIYGNRKFAADLGRKYKITERVRPRGRPRKTESIK